MDLRWARDQAGSLRSADPRLQDAVADLAAAIRHVPKDSLIGEHIRRRRRAVRAVVATAAVLVVLLAFSLAAAFVAKGQRDRADRENTVATAGLLASTAVALTGSRPDLAQLFAVQAYRLDPGNPQARAALFATVQADPQVQRFLMAPGPVSALAISPDGRVDRRGHQERMGTRLGPGPLHAGQLRPDGRAGHRAWRSARTGPRSPRPPGGPPGPGYPAAWSRPAPRRRGPRSPRSGCRRPGGSPRSPPFPTWTC